MIPYLGCESAREMLDAAIDGELPITEQVALEAHLRWCRTCTARLEDMQIIRASIHLGSAAVVRASDPMLELAGVCDGVLSRIRVERDQSLPVRLRELCEDRRLLWPVVGATAGLAVCLWVALAVWNAATAVTPESLAAMIERLGNPGSNQYPLTLDDRMSVPRTLSTVPGLESIPGDEVAMAFATVVTREGRIAISRVLLPQGASMPPRDAAASVEDVDKVLDAVNRSRFTPAQSAAGAAVAVNMVWLIARTTAEPDTQLEALLSGKPLPSRRRVKRMEPPRSPATPQAMSLTEPSTPTDASVPTPIPEAKPPAALPLPTA